jgi:uncharacterized membrane protein
MAFCKHCGAPVDDGVKFCATCGQPVDGFTPTPQQAVTRQSDFTAEYDAEDIANNKYLGIFCYLGFLGIILALLAGQGSRFVRFHANQGLVLQVFMICLGIICIIPILGWIVAGIGFIFSVVLMIMGIVYSCQGRAQELPLIGRTRTFR